MAGLGTGHSLFVTASLIGMVPREVHAIQLLESSIPTITPTPTTPAINCPHVFKVQNNS